MLVLIAGVFGFKRKTNSSYVSNFVFNTVPADGLASLGVRPTIGTVIT